MERCDSVSSKEWPNPVYEYQCTLRKGHGTGHHYQDFKEPCVNCGEPTDLRLNYGEPTCQNCWPEEE